MLINPLLVGRFIGPEGVAGVALTIRLIEALRFVNGAIERVAYAVLAKIQHDSRRLQTAINEAMLLQVFSLVPFLIAFSVFSRWFIPFFLDDSWLPVIELFPYLALSCIVGSIFSLHMNVLYVRGLNWQVTKYGLAYVIVFSGATIAFVPAIGLIGYAIAEVAAICTFYLLHSPVNRICKLNYYSPFMYVLVSIPALFIPLVGFPWMLLLLLPLTSLVLFTRPRNQIIGVVKHLLRRNAIAGGVQQ